MLFLKRALIGLMATAVVTTLTTDGREAFSHESQFTADATALRSQSRPVLEAARVNPRRVRLTWVAPAPKGRTAVTGYRVTRSGPAARRGTPQSAVVSASRRAFTFSGLRLDSRYTFEVTPRYRSGYGRTVRVTLSRRAGTASSAPVGRVGGTPGPPVISSSSVGDQSMSVTWQPPARTGSSAITGYRVARSGIDIDGKGPWSTVVPATDRSFTMTLLSNGSKYTFSVRAVNKAGQGSEASVVLVPGGAAQSPPVSTGIQPYVAQSAVGQPVSLRQGGVTGAQLKMAGVSVWGIPDSVTGGGGFGLRQYENRAAIAAAIKGWGANHIRLRVLADDYNYDRQGLSKSQRLEMIKGWRDAAVDAGLYLYVTWWDSLDGYAEDGNWPQRYSSAFPMMTDVYRTLGNDPHVFYEPFNEPNSFGDQWNAWSTAMRATVAHWRSIGYTGLLIIDTPVWSHAYDDAAMLALEQYDAGLPGMGGKMQLAFARHDYANEGWTDNSFDPNKWRHETGGSQQHHLIWETEFGNYNGDPSTVHPAWSEQAAQFFADELSNPSRPNFVGATAFVWGSWWDANALTDSANNPTAWGRAVRDRFLMRAGAPRF